MAFLTIEQTAKEFDSSVHTLRTIAKDGGLPGARKIGGRWFVYRATLERFFETSLPQKNGAPKRMSITTSDSLLKQAQAQELLLLSAAW